MTNQRIQQLIFGLFIVLFFVSAPLVVLYTAGYRWNPQQGVVQTGTLFLASTPRNARITLNGDRHKDTTPTVVKTLRPGSYTVGLSLPEHLPWEKQLDVRQGETTFIENVLLFLDTAPVLRLREDMQNVSWSPANDRVAWAYHQAGWTEIWVSRTDQPASRLIHRQQIDEDVRLTWLDGETIQIDSAIQVTVTINGERVTQEDTAEQISFFSQGDTVDVRVDGRQIARLPSGNYRVLDQRDPYILLQETASQVVSLLTLNDQDEPLLLQEEAIYVEWIRQDALAFATPYAIHIYEPSTHETTLITRISERIHNVVWHPDGGYLFYATDTEVRVIELDERNGRRMTVLATLPDIQSFVPNARGTSLYIVGSDGIDTGLFERVLYKRSRSSVLLPGT